ncbi:katanin p80 WD40 repeat-containing subunit B1 homolog KTN80.3-like [Arachis hypogaea]|uniref:katanin p80 WD40 repeat-containing subunit B1 homolog KTN80.3-like n=1 Tax=Arachis hypogaea TaxID=3818 RepID=UPI0034E77716
MSLVQGRLTLQKQCELSYFEHTFEYCKPSCENVSKKVISSVGVWSLTKDYSWDTIICHDSVDVRWTTLGDLLINGKLLGCLYYRNFVVVCVADISGVFIFL